MRARVLPTIMAKVTNEKTGREILLSGTRWIASPRARTSPSSAITRRRRRWTITPSSHLSSLLLPTNDHNSSSSSNTTQITRPNYTSSLPPPRLICIPSPFLGLPILWPNLSPLWPAQLFGPFTYPALFYFYKHNHSHTQLVIYFLFTLLFEQHIFL